jgi:hypothetical protein
MHTFNAFITKHLYKAVKSTILFIVGLLPGISLKAEYIGTFVITYLSLGGGFIFMCLMLGINPTLVMSVISAPIWIFIVYIANKITKVIMEHKEQEEVDVITEENSRF